MERIAVVGCGGAGKSTLARRLGLITGLPVVHLDAHYWSPGWTPTPRERWRDVVAGLVAAPRWIMDGNYQSTFDLRFARADTVVFLDYGRLRCLWRALRRRVAWWGATRPDMAPDCPERGIDGDFFRWIWRFPADGRARILSHLEGLGPDRTVVRLDSPGAADAWLLGLPHRTSA